jgi:predicted transcriptional regulator
MVTSKTRRKVRLSITVDPELKTLAEKVADETKSTPSAVISQCLEDLAKKRKERSMISYYQDMAQEHDDSGKKTARVMEITVKSWDD